MKKLIIPLLSLFSFQSFSQEIQFETRFSHPLAVYQFISNLSANARSNPFKKLFDNSPFHTEQYAGLISRFDSLKMDYSYEFTQYPLGQKVGGDIGSFIRRNLILSTDAQDFKLRSLGLIPNADLIVLCDLLNAFGPVYDSIVYAGYGQHFETQLKKIGDIVREKNVNHYFGQALQFFNSSWDHSIPFIFCFYPLPNSRGWTATAVSNVALSPIPDSLNDFNGLLSVMLHEISHILYDEKSLSSWTQIDNWFTSNPSKCMRYAYALFNEAMATAVGNGYMAAQLNGKEKEGNWYNSKYISQMAKKAYPMVRDYINSQRSMDSAFVKEYIKLYDENFSSWLTEMDNLMYSALVMSDEPADFQIFQRSFHTQYDREKGISGPSLEKMKKVPGTKVIVINKDHQKELRLVETKFDEITTRLDAKKDFTYSLFLKDRTWLILLNNVTGNTEEKLKNLVLKEPG